MSDETTPPQRRLREHVAEELRALLARKRISAAELARRTGIKQSTLSRRMTGETAFDMDDLEVIADVLGVTVMDLMPQRATAGSGPIPGFTHVSRSPAPAPAAHPRRATRRPTGRTSRADRRPQQVRTPGRTIPSSHAA